MYDGYMDTEEKKNNTLLIEGDVIENGTTAGGVGFNQYVGGKLSFIDENFTIELKVSRTYNGN